MVRFLTHLQREDTLSDTIVGLDIGTSVVRVAIAEIDDEGNLNIIGLSCKESKGLKNGAILNLEAASSVIKEVIEEVETDAGADIASCVAGIGGSQIGSLNSRGQSAISKHGKSSGEITRADVDRVIENARSVPIPIDREIIHVIPKYYCVDGLSKIKDPINMIGVRLETEIHIVTASKTAIQNERECINRAGYEIDKIMQKTLAATNAVLHQDEMDLGSILIDLGAGTTDVLVIYEGAPLVSFSIKIGGNLVTNDIAIVKGIPIAAAEEIKVNYGNCFVDMLANPKEVKIPGVGGRPPELTTQTEIAQIIQPRMEEIFMMVLHEIRNRTNLSTMSGNIVLIGGGSQMDGALELAKAVFGTQSVRLGIPESIGILDGFDYRKPEFATVIGLVLSQKYSGGDPARKAGRKKTSEKSEGFLRKLKRVFF